MDIELLVSRITLVVQSRRLINCLNALPIDRFGTDYFPAYNRAWRLRHAAYMRLRRRLAIVPIIGQEILTIREMHSREVASMQDLFRSLWEHPEFNRDLHHWVGDMFEQDDEDD